MCPAVAVRLNARCAQLGSLAAGTYFARGGLQGRAYLLAEAHDLVLEERVAVHDAGDLPVQVLHE